MMATHPPTARVFDPDHILDDRFLTGSSSLDVQHFLERLDSPLAALEVGGERVSSILQRVARETPIDARVLLTKLQVEQSLITSEPTQQRLDWAMGYGLTDQDIHEEYRGFENQVRMAAHSLTGYLKPDHPFSVLGQVGQPWNVRDGLVTPRNAATAALYRYTPWIGNRSFGELDPPFGNYLFFLVWQEFFGVDPREVPEGFLPLTLPWRVIAPPDNWRSPIELPDDRLSFVLELARRLNLVVTQDLDRRKLYLGLPRELPPAPPPPLPVGATITYPSGVTVPVIVPEDAIERGRYGTVAETAAPLITADRDLRLSSHFVLGEFLPNDPSYRYARLSPDLVELLETLRSELGAQPLIVTSGYRPPLYNQSVGGVPNSAHVDGLAADIYSDQVPLLKLWSTAERLVGDRGGVGYYPAQGFVHVDLRGYRARWVG